jgi:sphingomyelin phosphodiesterase
VIISLNSDVWYYFNIYSYIQGNIADHTGMFAVLIDYLLEAEAYDQPVWLIQHVNTGGSTDYESLPAPSDLWYAVVDRFNNTIRGTFFGHTHADEFGVIYSNNATVQNADTAAAVAWIMPSVTPYQNLNSGFRYYLIDPDTFEVMDSITYYADIADTDAWQETGNVTWQFEYSARETYNYDGRWPDDVPLTPAFWHSVAVDIAENATTFQTYTDLRTKKVRPYVPPTALDAELTICGLTSMSVPIFERCLGTTQSTTVFL